MQRFRGREPLPSSLQVIPPPSPSEVASLGHLESLDPCSLTLGRWHGGLGSDVGPHRSGKRRSSKQETLLSQDLTVLPEFVNVRLHEGFSWARCKHR